MGKAVAIHSHKGGTGKTLIAANLASIFARRGKNVCLLDYDFRAPSQQVVFKHSPEHWLNDFLEKECSLDEVLVDFSRQFHTDGRLYVGFANPNPAAMLDMITKDRAWQSNALKLIMEAREELHKDMQIDYLFFDTTPGIHFSAVDAVATSDIAMLVMRPDRLDVEGTKILVKAIYHVLEKKTGLLVNKYISKLVCVDQEAQIQLPDEKSTIENLGLDLPLMGIIPCYCDLMLTGGESIHVLDKPNHPFVSKLRLVADRIDEFTS